MPNYQKGKIYALRSHQTDDVYIGSTCQLLCQRKGGHKVKAKRWKNGKCKYVCTSHILCEYDDMYIELVENYPCNSKTELLRREGEIIRQTEHCINKAIAGRTSKEYVKDNLEKTKAYKQRWHKENKERMNAKSKQNYLDNKERYNAQSKANYQKNKAKQLAKQAKKYTCECGKTLSIGKRARHEKSRKHIAFINGENISDPSRKYTCKCGAVISKHSKRGHEKSQKHIKAIEALN